MGIVHVRVPLSLHAHSSGTGRKDKPNGLPSLKLLDSVPERRLYAIDSPFVQGAERATSERERKRCNDAVSDGVQQIAAIGGKYPVPIRQGKRGARRPILDRRNKSGVAVRISGRGAVTIVGSKLDRIVICENAIVHDPYAV